jgi:hypothetical protein
MGVFDFFILGEFGFNYERKKQSKCSAYATGI